MEGIFNVTLDTQPTNIGLAILNRFVRVGMGMAGLPQLTIDRSSFSNSLPNPQI